MSNPEDQPINEVDADEEVVEMTDEEKREMEKNQEAKLKQMHGAEELKNTKHSYLIKKDRKKFDSADYVMKKNNAENKGETVPKAIKKGEIAQRRFGSHLTGDKKE